MKNNYIAIAALFFAGTALAQPTVTMNNMPQLGDVLPIGFCSDIPVAATLNAETGANYDWDFSTLNEFQQGTILFGTADTTEWDTAFTDAELVGTFMPDQTYQYYRFSNGMAENLGNAFRISPTEMFYQRFTDSENILNLPVTFNDTDLDIFEGYGEGAGFAFTTLGMFEYFIDGHGTLELPNGSYSNVIRMRNTREENTFVSGVPGGSVSKEQWIWVSSDFRFWLLLMEIVDDGFGPSFNVWYQKTPMAVGVEEAQLPEIQMLHPNPVASSGTLYLDARFAQAAGFVEIWTIEGRLLASQAITGSQVNIHDVVPGVYLVKLIDRKGTPTAFQRLIVK